MRLEIGALHRHRLDLRWLPFMRKVSQLDPYFVGPQQLPGLRAARANNVNVADNECIRRPVNRRASAQLGMKILPHHLGKPLPEDRANDPAANERRQAQSRGQRPPTIESIWNGLAFVPIILGNAGSQSVRNFLQRGASRKKRRGTPARTMNF